MRVKTKLRVGENPLTDAKARRYLRSQVLPIAQSALPLIKDRLNKTEEPVSDPRKSHINVKKWDSKIISQRAIYNHKTGKGKSSIVYTILIRATNSQPPTSYIAYRRRKNPPNVPKAYIIPREIYMKDDAIISREEIERIYRLEKLTRSTLKGMKSTRGIVKDKEAITRNLVYQRYKKLIPVKVLVDNIAFSRMFSAKNTIKPNPSKYGPYSYTQCLKTFNKSTGLFEYAMYSRPKANNHKYYNSRLYVMREAIFDSIDKLNEDSGEWK